MTSESAIAHAVPMAPATLKSPHPHNGGWFGVVAMTDDIHGLFVGAPAEVVGAHPNAGHAYVY